MLHSRHLVSLIVKYEKLKNKLQVLCCRNRRVVITRERQKYMQLTRYFLFYNLFEEKNRR